MIFGPLLLTLQFALATSESNLTPDVLALRQPGIQSDFPSMAIDRQNTPWVAYVEWDGQQDQLCLAKVVDQALTKVMSLGTPGIIHQPALATDGQEGLVVVWSQVNAQDVMELQALRVVEGQPEGPVQTLASSTEGGNVFARAATDRHGRVWVTWQSHRGKLGDIFCRYFDPTEKVWSREIQVTDESCGDWEPCLAFDHQDGAWILYDSSEGNEFNIYAQRVQRNGKVGERKRLIHTDRYEGRTSAIGTADGRGIWFTCERGNQQWGLDMRAHGGQQGLNGRKESVLAYWDLESGQVEEMPAIDPLLAQLPGPAVDPNKPPPRASNPAAQAKAEERAKARATATKKSNQPPPGTVAAVNLPQVMLDGQGRPWIAVRYFKNYCWRLALASFDRATKQWSQPFALPDATYGQDRRVSHGLTQDGQLWLCWISDLRASKLHQTAGIQLARVATESQLAWVSAPALKPVAPFAAYIDPVTPERPRDERHTWTHQGTTYKLYWGDFHRHTDVSNCITANDGCVHEQFRYAWDMGKLDILGTSDHTDIAKIYHPYEWWLNQKMVDVFYAPGFFNSMYAYEREQKWPYGHRNMVFAQRGGPIVYIQRANYLASPWQALYPVATDGEKELSPEELWDVLVRYGKPVTAISHTGATSMGTDWNIFDRIDHRVENVIEIYQGARVSYEGLNAPQPTVGLREGERYNPSATIAGEALPGQPIRSFTDKDNGLYQNALARGHKLGVWANSDHISTHTSYGGVYVKEFTREGIIEGLNARRTIAATDKIFVEFTCNDELLGTETVVTGKPRLAFKIDGTADIQRVTLVRNEQNYQQWQPSARRFAQSFTDEAPLVGENRYYLRIEQSDGNMAWSSPVWVSVK
jgi:hypothetical protein